MYSISKLCKEYDLSRSTLLYYDGIGLLKPSGRTDSNYRIYSEEDKARLGKICTFREAGVPLEQIRNLLDSAEEDSRGILGKRLKEINHEIRYLRLQQNILVEMLKSIDSENRTQLLDKCTLLTMFKSAGLEVEMLDRFHKLFEQNIPDVHQLFLEYLGIPAEEIEQIRKDSKSMK